MPTHKEDSILNFIRPQLVKVDETNCVLGLEILIGPYTGVVYSYSHFEVMDETDDASGLRRTKFETTVHTAPDGFVPEEAFDHFCGEVLVEWLEYLSETDHMNILLQRNTQGVH